MSKRLALLVAFALIIGSSAGIVSITSAQEGAAGGVASTPSSAAGEAQSPALGAESRARKSLEQSWAPDRLWRANDGTLYRMSEEEGLLVSFDGGVSWQDRTEDLPRRAVWPFARMLPPLVTSLFIDPRDASHVALTTADAVWLSKNAGVSWKRIDVREPLKPNDQLTSVALASDGLTMAVGTSFHGLFETADQGGTWTDLTEKTSEFQLGGGTYEEMASVAYDPLDPNRIYLALGFGKGLWRLARGTRKVERLGLPQGVSELAISDIAWRGPQARGDWVLEVRTRSERWILSPSTGEWRMDGELDVQMPPDPERASRRAKASGKVGIYVSAYKASGSSFDSHLAFLKSQGLNSLVVDCKDDYGNVTYDTTLELPWKLGVVRKYFSIDELVAKAHAEGMYVIGRIVVFRDKGLFNAPGYPYAAWDRIANAPWRYLKKEVDEETGEEKSVQGEYWVDPFSEDVWRYNIDIAREVQDHGFDEVQFDYMRFPSDGDVSRITWRFRREGMGKVEALESFLAAARAALEVPISIDVYGYCGWARISAWVAQAIETFSRHVDVISPMFYPSHFPREFLGSMPYLERARYIYREGSNRAESIVADRALIRPFVQAFRIGDETKFSSATTSAYLVNQVLGTLEGASSGFTLWNASNDYYMVSAPLGPLIAATLKGAP